MHQEHNIPWNKLASNFKFVRNNPSHTPHATGLFPRNLLTQGQDLNYFTRVLAKTITTFSETERAKYGNTFDAGSPSLLFSDELRDRYPEYLNEKNQRIQTWIDLARREENGRYNTLHGSLADVVKILINQNEVPTLLMLAHHPQICLSSLRHLSWGHHFGFSRVAESALQFYILLNLFAATATLQRGEYLESRPYADITYDLTQNMDFPAQQLPYKDFLDTLRKDPKTSLPEIHHDLPRLQELLKVAFCLLYRYDVVLRECNVGPNWEKEIHHCLQWATGHLKDVDRRTWSENRYGYNFA